MHNGIKLQLKELLTHESAVIKSFDPLFCSLIERCTFISDVVSLLQTLPYEENGSGSNVFTCHPLHRREITCTLPLKLQSLVHAKIRHIQTQYKQPLYHVHWIEKNTYHWWPNSQMLPGPPLVCGRYWVTANVLNGYLPTCNHPHTMHHDLLQSA